MRRYIVTNQNHHCKCRRRKKSTGSNVEHKQDKQDSSRKVMQVTNEDGTVDNAKVILAFEFKDDRKDL